MIVLVNGLPLFSKRLVEDLSSVDKHSKYYFFDTYNSFWAKIKFIAVLPFAKIVISFNGVSDKSGSLKWVLFFRKKLVMQWQGTDVLLAIERYKNGSIYWKYIKHATHFHDSSWLGEEISSIGISSEILWFKYGYANTKIQKYKHKSVLAYIPQNSQEFYGIHQTIAAALAFPELEFIIMGMTKCDFQIPSNLKLIGWQSKEEVSDLMEKIPILIRITKHDGFSVSVIESLAKGQEVIWSFPFSNCHFSRSSEDLILMISNCIELIEKRDCQPNEVNMKLISEQFNRETILKRYVKKLYEVARK
jgi:glycosyltransferase involved in cell wall biosynthesis